MSSHRPLFFPSSAFTPEPCCRHEHYCCTRMPIMCFYPSADKGNLCLKSARHTCRRISIHVPLQTRRSGQIAFGLISCFLTASSVARHRHCADNRYGGKQNACIYHSAPHAHHTCVHHVATFEYHGQGVLVKRKRGKLHAGPMSDIPLSRYDNANLSLEILPAMNTSDICIK